VLPDELALNLLLTAAPGWKAQSDLSIPLGIEADSMNPLLVDLTEAQNLLIVGPAASGKTTLLQSMLLALAERHPPSQVQIYLSGLTGMQLQPFARLPHTQTYIEDSGQLNETVTELVALLNQRRRDYEQEQRSSGRGLDERTFAARYPALVLAIDDYADARSAMSQILDDTWREFLRLGRRFGLVVLVASPAAYFQAFYGDELGKTLKDQGSIILLGGTDADSVHSFGLKLKPEERGKTFSAGRGYYKRRAVQQLFQSASCQLGALQLSEWIEQIGQKQ
ncbi:MAG: FtsK/SpoIIIE domain-containing protein, partial [Chloroflexales bacterium]